MWFTLIPFKTSNTYLGASSNLLSTPENKPRSNSVGYLIQEASNMISSEIGKSCFAGLGMDTGQLQLIHFHCLEKLM